MSRDNEESAREGGREPAKPVTSGFDRSAAPQRQRNSSGSASAAASILDLRQRVNYIFNVLEVILQDVHPELVDELRSMRQRGFRRGP